MEYKLTDLAIYYINHYNLRAPGVTDDPDDYIRATFIKKVRQKIYRILSDTKLEKTSLYDIIKSKEKPSVHKISVDTFEKYCFEDFAAYIERNIEEYDHAALERDKKDHYAKKDHEYWEKEAKKFREETDEAIKSGAFNRESKYDNLYISYHKPEEIRDIGQGMILEALYNVFYEDFNWKQLIEDLDLADEIDYNLGADNNSKQIEAQKRLDDFHNYIGDQKRKW